MRAEGSVIHGFGEIPLLAVIAQIRVVPFDNETDAVVKLP